jgi:uncharacterized protein (TIGR02722 family)
MKKLMLILVLCVTGCASTKKFTNGAYNNPQDVKLIDDKFNEADMQQITKTMVDALLRCAKVTEDMPTVVIGSVQNQTAEHLNLDAVTDQIQTQLVKSNRFVFLDKRSRTDIDAEEAYLQVKDRSINSLPVPPNYVITGAISSNVQEFNKQKVVYYKFNLNLTSTKTTAIACAEEKELRKEFEQKSY